MEHKLLLFGNGINKEVEIGNAKELTIGTDKRCQVWLTGEVFPKDFLIKLLVEGDFYTVQCEGDIELRRETDEKVGLCEKVYFVYKGQTNVLFCLILVNAFNSMTSDYHLEINLAEISSITIGTQENSDIRIDAKDLPAVFVELIRNQQNYILKVIDGVNLVTHNGSCITDDSFLVEEADFFSVANIQFWYSNGKLYTENNEGLTSRLSTKLIQEQNNKLKYPEFVRNVRLQFKQPQEELEVLDPKQKPNEPEGGITDKLLPMLISMIIMTIMRVMVRSNITYAIYFVVMMGTSSMMTVMGIVRSKKKYKENVIQREKIYNDYIEKKDQEIQEKRYDERLIAQKMCVLPQQTIEQIENFDARLFEKLKEHDDFLDVPIGVGIVDSENQIKYKKHDFIETEDPLMNIPENVHDKYEKISDMPVVLHLREVNAVGFLGTRNKLYQMAKNIMISLAGQHFYKDVKFYVMLNVEDIKYFKWIRWFQNLNEVGKRNILYDDGSKKNVLESIYNELSAREGLKKDELKELPHYIVFAYRSENMSGHPITNYVKKASDLGFTFLFFEEYKELMHEACEDLVCLDRESYSGFVQKTDDAVETINFSYPHLSSKFVEAAALKLACVHVNEISLESTLTKNITLYQLLKIMSAYDLNIAERWNKSDVYESMAAALGVDSSGQVVYLDLHEKAHGPHGLVAGTTGSGKSEILQSYVLSMCVNFHPYEVGFVIIDFKGGGMANQFKDLPHLNGAITNIDGKQIDRSLMSIKAELMKRQKLFAEYSVNRIDDYIKLYKDGVAHIPLPHLILIVDEFAELKSDQPEFMKELISAARIGRSLGMHLILATQKPAGVVNDQIWSNSRFKLCLKVQDKSDSKEVLKSPLAAEIREPGRAYLQVGNNEIFQLFQSAYSGASVNVEQMEQQRQFAINIVDFAGRRKAIYSQKPKKSNGDSETQLDAIVSYIAEHCRENSIDRLPDICLPPLAEIIPYPEKILKEDGETDIIVPVGIYDNPSEQEQSELRINITKNNICVLGSSLTGKTNFMQVLIRGLCEKYSASEICIYIIDFASMMLKNFESLNQVGGVVTLSEDTKLKQLLGLLLGIIDERKNYLSEQGLSSFSAYREAGFTDMKQIVLIIENYSMVRTVYLDYEGLFGNICRDGLSVGVSVIITNTISSGIGIKMMTHFGEKITFYQNDSNQYNMVLDHCKLHPDNYPGRGILSINNSIREFQTYLAFSAEKEIEKVAKIRDFASRINAKNKGIMAVEIPTVPETVTEELISNRYGYDVSKMENYTIPFGIRYDDIQPEYVNLETENFISITGKNELGRNQFIKYMLNHLVMHSGEQPVDLYIVDDVSQELSYTKEWPITKTYTNKSDKVKGILEQIFEEAKKRYDILSADVDALNEKPLIILIFNSKLTEDLISIDPQSKQMHEMLIRKLNGTKVCIMHTNANNTAPGIRTTGVGKLVNENSTIFAFEEIKQIKLVSVSTLVSKTYAKKMEYGDAFCIKNSAFKKMRMTHYLLEKENNDG